MYLGHTSFILNKESCAHPVTTFQDGVLEQFRYPFQITCSDSAIHLIWLNSHPLNQAAHEYTYFLQKIN